MTGRVPAAPWWMPIAIVAAGWWAYHGSLAAAFVFDDRSGILANASIRRLWPIGPVLAATARPLVNLTLALNYALSGLAPWSYHAANVAIHLAAALVLFGMLRRLLGTRRHPDAGTAPWLAWASAMLWVVHPLTTEAVAYAIQRAESLAGLCYLLTVDALLRGAGSARPRRWYVLSIAACALGMAAKPILVTAPLVALCLDRVFVAGSWRGAWRSRGRVYLALMATWLIGLGLALWHPDRNAGLGLSAITPVAYARTQPGVILHYLRLACWPSTLVLDYGWPVAAGWRAVGWPALLVGLGLVLTGWGVRRGTALSALGVWWFGSLAASSSVFPILDLAVEHRAYLALAAVTTAVVLLFWAIVRRLAARWHKPVAGMAVIAAALLLGTVTMRRVALYRDPAALWAQTVQRRPNHARAHNNLGRALAGAGDEAGAAAAFHRAIELDPGFVDAWYNLGLFFARRQAWEPARECLARVVAWRPRDVEALTDLGVVLAAAGRPRDAVDAYQRALAIEPAFARAAANLREAQAHPPAR